jgi:hypothetical protein
MEKSPTRRYPRVGDVLLELADISSSPEAA